MKNFYISGHTVDPHVNSIISSETESWSPTKFSFTNTSSSDSSKSAAYYDDELELGLESVSEVAFEFLVKERPFGKFEPSQFGLLLALA